MRQINPGRIGRLRTSQPLIGPLDGVNTVFSTTSSFLHTLEFSEALYLRGIRLLGGDTEDYLAVESGGPGAGYDTVVLAAPPEVGDVLQIDYYPSSP